MWLCTPLISQPASLLTPRRFDLPVDSAEVSLRRFSKQSGMEVLYATRIATDVTTKAVQGAYAPMEAVALMLADTGLAAEYNEVSGVIIIKQHETTPMNKPLITKLRRTLLGVLLFFTVHHTAPAQTAPNEPDKKTAPGSNTAENSKIPVAAGPGEANSPLVKLSPFEVRSDPVGYGASSSTSGTRLDTPLKDLSKNIVVLTRDLIEDQGTTDLNEAVAYAAAVSVNGPDQGQGLSVRGFGGNSPKRNGLGIYGSDESIYDTATMDRIEVVKGPSALLYGVSSPGGLINYITKQPLPVEESSLRLMYGSWENYRAEFDTGGPLVGNGHTLNHRLIVAGGQGNSWAKYGHETRGLVSEDLRWFIGDKTYITIGGEYNQVNSNVIRTLDYPGVVWPAIYNPDGTLKQAYSSISLTNRSYLGITPYTTHDTVVKRLDFDVAHEFTDTLNFFFHYNYISNNLSNMGEFEQLAEGVGAGVGPNQASETLYMRLPHRSSRNFTASFSDKFEGAWGKMEVVAGVEYFNYFLSFRSDVPKVAPIVNFVTGEGYDVPQPNTETQVDNAIIAGTWINQFKYFEHQDYTSPYLVTHTHLFNDRLRIILGVRHDSIRDGQDFYGNANDPTDPFKLLPATQASYYTQKTSPMVGVSFNPIDHMRQLALYYTYSESLQPNEVVDQYTGKGLGPQTGKGHEVGLKYDLPNKMLLQVGLYNIEKTGVPETVGQFNPPHTILGGLQRAKGADLDITYNPIPGWQLMGGLAYVDAHFITDSDPGNVGQRLQSIPRFRATSWTKYTFQPGSKLRGFSFGGGAIYNGDTIHSYAYPGLSTKAWYRLDLMAGYSMKIGAHQRMDYQLLVTNVFDKSYASNLSSLAPPRKIQATVTYHY